MNSVAMRLIFLVLFGLCASAARMAQAAQGPQEFPISCGEPKPPEQSGLQRPRGDSGA